MPRARIDTGNVTPLDDGKMIVEIPYRPRLLQRKMHEERTRFVVMVCHRRFGKTVLGVNELIRGAFVCLYPDPRFNYVAPQLKQAKRIAWDYVLRYTRNLPDRYVNHAELRVDFPVGPESSARIQLLGADDPDTLRGAYCDGVLFDEYAQIDPRAWTEVFRPMLADRNGWAMFTGTPQGPNHFRELYDDAALPESIEEGWSRYMFKASETGLVLPNELAAARRVMTAAQYEQEFECSWTAAIPGAYYSELMDAAEREGRITDVAHDPMYPTEAWFDLGVGDATAIWIVQRSRKPRPVVLYATEATGLGIPDYISIVKGLPYQPITRWIAPFDMNVRDYGLAGAPTRKEVAWQYGVNFEVLERIAPEEGRDMVRRFLPTCVFDRKGTKEGRNALVSHRSAYDGKNQTLRLMAVHDWTSHFADSFRYGCQAGEDIGTRMSDENLDKYLGSMGGFAA